MEMYAAVLAWFVAAFSCLYAMTPMTGIWSGVWNLLCLGTFAVVSLELFKSNLGMGGISSAPASEQASIPWEPLPAPARTGDMDEWRKLVGHPQICDAWAKVSELVLQDLVYDTFWGGISPDVHFPKEVRRVLNNAFGILATRAKRLDEQQALLNIVKAVTDTVSRYLDVRADMQSLYGVDELLKTGAFHQFVKAELMNRSKLPECMNMPAELYTFVSNIARGITPTLLEQRGDQLLDSFVSQLLVVSVFKPMLSYTLPENLHPLLTVSLRAMMANSPDPSNPPAEPASPSHRNGVHPASNAPTTPETPLPDSLPARAAASAAAERAAAPLAPLFAPDPGSAAVPSSPHPHHLTDDCASSHTGTERHAGLDVGDAELVSDRASDVPDAPPYSAFAFGPLKGAPTGLRILAVRSMDPDKSPRPDGDQSATRSVTAAEPPPQDVPSDAAQAPDRAPIGDRTLHPGCAGLPPRTASKTDLSASGRESRGRLRGHTGSENGHAAPGAQAKARGVSEERGASGSLEPLLHRPRSLSVDTGAAFGSVAELSVGDVDESPMAEVPMSTSGRSAQISKAHSQEVPVSDVMAVAVATAGDIVESAEQDTGMKYAPNAAVNNENMTAATPPAPPAPLHPAPEVEEVQSPQHGRLAKGNRMYESVEWGDFGAPAAPEQLPIAELSPREGGVVADDVADEDVLLQGELTMHWERLDVEYFDPLPTTPTSMNERMSLTPKALGAVRSKFARRQTQTVLAWDVEVVETRQTKIMTREVLGLPWIVKRRLSDFIALRRHIRLSTSVQALPRLGNNPRRVDLAEQSKELNAFLAVVVQNEQLLREEVVKIFFRQDVINYKSTVDDVARSLQERSSRKAVGLQGLTPNMLSTAVGSIRSTLQKSTLSLSQATDFVSSARPPARPRSTSPAVLARQQPESKGASALSVAPSNPSDSAACQEQITMDSMSMSALDSARETRLTQAQGAVTNDKDAADEERPAAAAGPSLGDPMASWASSQDQPRPPVKSGRMSSSRSRKPSARWSARGNDEDSLLFAEVVRLGQLLYPRQKTLISTVAKVTIWLGMPKSSGASARAAMRESLFNPQRIAGILGALQGALWPQGQSFLARRKKDGAATVALTSLISGNMDTLSGAFDCTPTRTPSVQPDVKRQAQARDFLVTDAPQEVLDQQREELRKVVCEELPTWLRMKMAGNSKLTSMMSSLQLPEIIGLKDHTDACLLMFEMLQSPHLLQLALIKGLQYVLGEMFAEEHLGRLIEQALTKCA